MPLAGWLVITLLVAGAPNDPGAPGALAQNVGAGNQKPKIEDVSFNPSKTFALGRTLTVTAEATDPDDDTLEFKWIVVGGANDDSDTQADGNTMTFRPRRAGRYKVELTVCDVPNQGKPLCATKKFQVKAVGRAPQKKKH